MNLFFCNFYGKTSGNIETYNLEVFLIKKYFVAQNSYEFVYIEYTIKIGQVLLDRRYTYKNRVKQTCRADTTEKFDKNVVNI